MEQTYSDFTTAKKTFSRIGLALCVVIVTATIFQILFLVVPDLIWGNENWFTASSWGMWLVTFIPLYALAMPAGFLIINKLPAQAPILTK